MEKLLSDPAVILNLPWATLVTLASGYMGYFIAHHGIRDHHKTIDVAFSTLVFGFFSAFAYQVSRYVGEGPLLASVFAALTACTIGATWRVWGRRLMRTLLRLGDISHADDVPSAWLSLFNETGVRATQLSVRLKDGTILLCDDLSRFEKKPNGPFVMGSSGDILMYVTDIKEPKAKTWETQEDVEYKDWGSVITHIPAAEISRVRFRQY